MSEHQWKIVGNVDPDTSVVWCKQCGSVGLATYGDGPAPVPEVSEVQRPEGDTNLEPCC